MAKGQLMAEGTYQWSVDGTQTGRETWQISQLGHGGIIVASRAEFTTPNASNWNLTFELDRSWSPLSLTVHVATEGQALASRQHREEDRWLAEVESGGQTSTYEQPFSSAHEVDFGSPLFNTVTLLRTRLPVGASRDLDVVFIPTDSLVPTADRQRYECLAEEKAQGPAGSYPGFKYRMTHPDRENARANEFWADRHGVIVDYQSRNGTLIEMGLARYRQITRR